jgi:CubicO group peptidase (beta-lactamase class C family)
MGAVQVVPMFLETPADEYGTWAQGTSSAVDAIGRPNLLLGQGNHGQFIYVAPERDLVLVRFGTDYNYDHWPELLAELARRL